MKNKTLSGILAILASIGIILFIAWSFLKTIDIMVDFNLANVPEMEVPPIPETPELPTPSSTTLLTESYTPSQNVYSSEIYNKESLKVVVGGEFSSAILKAHGAVLSDNEHFVSINFGTESGTLNAVRAQSDKLDIDATRKNGGVFTKDTGFDISVDLINGASLATSKKEFQATQQSTKLVKFWQAMALNPPTVTRLLVAPFNKDGKFGGIKVDSVEIEYTCAEGSNCIISLCPNEQPTTQCLEEKINTEAKNSWCERSKVCP